jgi:hypothetical protein
MAIQATAVLDRLIHDDYLHEQLTRGGDRLLAAYRRGRALRAQDAAQDKKLFEHARASAGSIVAAGRRLAGKPEPEPKRRRRLPVLVIGVGVLALVRSMHRTQQARAAPAG